MTTLVMETAENITKYLNDVGDPRVRNWPMMESPWPTLQLVTAYVIFSLVAGPVFMKDRKPFEFRGLLIAYNAAQVLINLTIFLGASKYGWMGYYNWTCQPVDYSYHPYAYRAAILCYCYLLSRMLDFLDTIFFVLRKKFSQISFLHVTHHALVVLSTWVGVKLTAGGQATFFGFLNSLIHVIMYTYYLLASLGPQYQKYLWWKKYLTVFQMIQFALIFFHTSQLYFVSCDFPMSIVHLTTFNSLLMFVLFSNFYYHAYILRKPVIKALKSD